MDAAGIDQCAAHSAATTAHQVSSINRFILSEANQFPDRIVPFATLHPDVADLESAIAEICAGGFSGIKLHPEFQGFKVDEPRAIRMFDLIGDRIPILLHCGDAVRDNSAPERILHLLKEVPRIRLVCAHLGGWQIWGARGERADRREYLGRCVERAVRTFAGAGGGNHTRLRHGARAARQRFPDAGIPLRSFGAS